MWQVAAVFYMVVREGFMDEMAFEHTMLFCDWKVFQVEGIVSAKALRQGVLGRLEEQQGSQCDWKRRSEMWQGVRARWSL